MEVFLPRTFLLQYENIETHCRKMEPFLNINQKSGYVFYRSIIILKTLYVMYAMETTIPRTWSLASIIAGTFYVIYMKPIMTIVALGGFVLHGFGLLMEEMTIMCIISMSYKSYEFLLDGYVLLCSLYYATEAYRREVEKLSSLLFLALAVGWRIGNISSLPFSLSDYCRILLLYAFTIFPLIPKCPKYRNRPIFFYIVMYLWIFYKLGQHYDATQSLAIHTKSRSHVCLTSQLNFEATRCSLNATVQEGNGFFKMLNMSDCASYDIHDSLDVLVKNHLKQMLLMRIHKMNQEKTTYEDELEGDTACAKISTNANNNERQNPKTQTLKETTANASPAIKELTEDKESKLIQTDDKKILILGEGESNHIFKHDCMGLRHELLCKDILRANEDSENQGNRINEISKRTESTENTYLNNDHRDISERFLAKELSGKDVNHGMKKWLANVKKIMKIPQQQETRTNQQVQLESTDHDDYSVCERRDNSSENLKESLINHSSFTTEAPIVSGTKHNSGHKESENELFNPELTDAVDTEEIEPDEFIDCEANVTDDSESHVFSKTSENDNLTEVGDAEKAKFILTDTLGTGRTKIQKILPGEIAKEKSEGLEAYQVEVVSACQYEAFSCETHADDYPNNADDGRTTIRFRDSRANEFKHTKGRDPEASEFEHTKARDPGEAELDSTMVGEAEIFQPRAIQARGHETNENRSLATIKDKIINISQEKANLCGTLAADTRRGARELAAEETLAAKVGDKEVNESQATEGGQLSSKQLRLVILKQTGPKRLRLVTSKQLSPKRLRLVPQKQLSSRVQKLKRLARVRLVRLQQWSPSAQKSTKLVRLNPNRLKMMKLDWPKVKRVRLFMVKNWK